METPEKIAAVIPCHNEARTIFSLVQEVQKFLPVVFVIDDGSTDDTAELARSAGAEVLRHDSPQGKGNALQSGWNLASKRGFEWAICLDGDGQHSPQDIPRFTSALGRAPLVIGNRLWNAEAIPPVRRFVNRWMSRRLSKASGRVLPDTQCGFRLVHLPLLASLPLTTTHFEIESEVLLAFLAAGHGVEFVPIEVIYKNERSKIRPVADSVRWFRWFWNMSRVYNRAKLKPIVPLTPKPSLVKNV